jgi:hypothetical protein
MKKCFAGIFFILLIISFTGLSSCQNRKAENQIKDREQKEIGKLTDSIKANVYPLPTSAAVIKMLTELEVGYNPGIANPIANVKKYFSSNKRALNMGVYGADLSYATLYNVEQQVANYLDAIRSLANELNMAQIYKQELYDSIRKNFDDRDKLVSILTDAFNNTYGYLSDNEQQNLALLVVGGAWVEGMYLTTNITEASYNVAGIAKVLLDQQNSFNTYLQITEPYLSDPNVGDFVKSLDPIKKVYEKLTTSLTDKDIKDITTAIAGIREKVVE